VTPAGHELLTAARPTHEATLSAALDAAARVPELAPLVRTLDRLGVV
jgi:hypothetical protein